MKDFSCLFYCMAVRMIWKEKERSMIRAVQMDSLRGLLRIRRMDRGPNARIRGLCRVAKGVNRVDEIKIAKMVYIGECVASRLVG